MKKFLIPFALTFVATIAFAEPMDPNACYKRCMDIYNHPSNCTTICYGP